ncbi:hypothetical protein [Haloferula sp. BvORR071]|uniref:hypothetical protein n=1 Tax=Haloferula sp. BvORR071 TaxID=1396141 RepID=UPI00055621CD|nr:hypothetical protein [Haloferula sp. BvORR071]
MKPFLLLALLAATATAQTKERWIYIPANFQADEKAAEVAKLLERAGKSGYTHALIADSKFSRLATVASNYAPNVAKVKAAAKQAKIEIVPSMFPVGYSNDALFHDPNLAEGLPVKDAKFVIKSGVATIVADPPVSLPGGEMNDRSGWGFIDDNMVVENGAMRSAPTDGNARLQKPLKVSPFRQYHVSVRIKSEGFGGGMAEIKAIGKNGRQLQWCYVKVKPDQDWIQHDVTFNSLDSNEVSLYFGVWGGHRGTLCWDDAKIEECGPVNLLRRPGTPLVAKLEGGRDLVEMQDFGKLEDKDMGTKPWAEEFTPWHEPPVIQFKTLKDGDILRISYYHTHIIYDGQVSGCVEEPAFQELLRDQANRVPSLWESKTHLMAHDEWRLLGWDESCKKSGLTPGGIAAKNLRFCTKLLSDKVPGGRILVWNDMFDPHHNAVKDYYLVNGSLEGSWEGLDPSVEIMNWNFGKRDESLAFFEKRGHAQIIAGFYDEPVANVSAWLASAAKVKKVKGFMYTTWRNDYSKIEEVAAILQKAGW